MEALQETWAAVGDDLEEFLGKLEPTSCTNSVFLSGFWWSAWKRKKWKFGFPRVRERRVTSHIMKKERQYFYGLLSAVNTTQTLPSSAPAPPSALFVLCYFQVSVQTSPYQRSLLNSFI